ncbi:uncharacterized protein LOC144749711 [Ciona intestinalis]
MPSAVEPVPKGNPTGQPGVVGLRSLPHAKLSYYARTPKPNPFSTVWLPMNASNRIVTDKKQDIMHMYYSRHLQDNAGQSDRPKTCFQLDNALSIPVAHTESTENLEMPPPKTANPPDSVKAAMWMTSVNSLAPFASLGKPTCGYFFSRVTDNKKRLTGIPPTNTVKWRSNTASSQ